MPPTEPRPARTARILYLGLLAGPLLFAGVALALLPPRPRWINRSCSTLPLRWPRCCSPAG